MVNASIPRAEYPRPQFVRADWLCLNGEWQFEVDQGDSGIDRGLLTRDLNDTIVVPFCPESPLSEVENQDYLNAVWYRRTVTIPQAWGERPVLLHFQAVDYDATVWVNGVEMGRHRGGLTPFSCDLQGVARPGQEITIVIRARDDHKLPQPRGKQSQRYGGYGPIYLRTTGIWQTVWLEPVPECALKRPRITPDVANRMFRVAQPLTAARPGLRVRMTLKDGAGDVCMVERFVGDNFVTLIDLPIPEDRCRLWSIEDPHLYDLDIQLLDADGKVVDHATSYAGLRSVTIDGKAIKINGQAVFQRLVLDQGYYPDGIMTAPTDEALRRDIELSQAAGFNGARLHQKVFEERFLYHADRMGYIVWGEFGDWGCNVFAAEDDHQQPSATYITQWLEALERDYSHPAIVGWCPLNETWQAMGDHTTALDDVTWGMYLATKAMDQSRPVLDTSGYSHRVVRADVYDSHDYDQNPETFAQRHASGAEPFVNGPAPRSRWWETDRPWSLPYQGQPYFVSEFGGIWWNPNVREGEDSWGYGDRPTSLAAFYDRFERLCSTLLDNPQMFGYCYTQLTDVYQEQNGIYTFERGVKFDMDRICRAQQRPAAIEQA
jgi:beta-galactosidase/beta-glucuronidase